MKRPDRKHVRPISKTGIGEKQFKPVLTGLRKRIDLSKVAHPLIVVADLRRGSLTSLDRYLAKHKGIPDHAVAVELRKLISGSLTRCRFRLVVIEHAHVNVGGRPSASNANLSTRQLQIVERFKELLASEGKKYRAEEIVQEELQVSGSTIRRALKKAEETDRKTAEKTKLANEMKATLQRRKEALRRLHYKDGGSVS